jgi:4a-hydroxytetrahydrobiopterin dehydratase
MTVPDEATPPTRGLIAARTDPLGWRLILGVLTTHVPVASLTAAVDAAREAIAAAGADAAGHLTAELHDDRVVLRVHTRTVGAVTGRDIDVAERISAAVDTRPGDPAAALQAVEIGIDALDIAAIRPFWQAVTGYADEPGVPDLPDNALLDPLRRGPAIWFQQMDAPRPQRNRIHLDVDVAPEVAPGRIEAALAAGGTLVDDSHAPAWWVLADPEGNEACVCTWQGRD